MNIAIIGGGAAGFFSAISLKEHYPGFNVTIFEKSHILLSKVRVSGGGRCNVTNSCETIEELCTAYPRGGKSLKRAFQIFNNRDTVKWFESRGVKLTTQNDNCIFPESQDSQTIIDCFIEEADRLNIEIVRGSEVKSLNPLENKIEIHFALDTIRPMVFDKVIVTTGGSPKEKNFEWLESLGHKIEKPVPSLFTFNIPNDPITQLMGIVVENAIVSIQGSKFKSDGPLLITHWGMSGPAILKLSSYGARALSEVNYDFKIQVNWVNQNNNDVVLNELIKISKDYPGKLMSNIKPYSLPSRLWEYILHKSEFPQDKKWSELKKKGLNKLVNTLTNDQYSVLGKSTFREEFVTCGGVSMQSIDLNTMESKVCKNLYFAGEVLDIDAITGGYNFQAAWTTGYICGLLK